MFAAIRPLLLGSLAAIAAVMVSPAVADASWITIRNDTKQAVVVQETVVVNGQVKRCKPVNLLPGEAHREFLSAPTIKKIDVFDAENPKRSLWSGSLPCKDESQTFSIAGSGESVTVVPVAGAPKAPRPDRK